MWTDLFKSIGASLNFFMYSICSHIYSLVANLYNLFVALCNARIVSSDLMQAFSSRIGLILGIIMLFRVIFSFIQILINPDTISDKEKGAFNLVKKIIIVIALLGVTPYIFNLSFRIQGIILGNNDGNVNVISRLLLPQSVNTDNFGGELSADLFLSFYTINLDISEEGQNDSEYTKCVSYINYLRQDIVEYNNFDLGYNCLDEKTGSIDVDDVDENGNKITVPVIRFNYILAIAVGLFVCWILLVYCFSVGVRVIQLAFLEIIAPMPIISYLSPKKDGMFQKWAKMCLTTYLDVFIRVAIINFIVLIIAQVINGFKNGTGTFWNSLIAGSNIGGVAGWKTSTFMLFVKVIIILALLQFAKKAPELLKELLPKSWAASGDFSFGLKNRDVLGRGLATVGGVAAGGAVGLIGGIAGGNNWKNRITGAAGGLLGGARRGIAGGISNKGTSFGEIGKGINNVRSKQSNVEARRAAAIAGGSTFFGRTAATVQKSLGVETAGERDTREIGYMDSYSKFLDSMKSAADNNGSIGKLKRAWESAEQMNGESAYDFAQRKEALRKTYKNAQKAYITAAMSGQISEGGNLRFAERKWDVASQKFIDTNGVKLVDDFENDDLSYSRQIVATAQQANRYQNEHRTALGSLYNVVDYATMENNTNEVDARKAERIASRSYDRNQANDKFSSKK